MQIRLVSTSKKRFLPLLLLADEQESMIDRYLERGDLYVMYDKLFTEPVAVAVVTDEGKGIRELKNLAVAPHWQRKGYGRQMSYTGNRRLSGAGTAAVRPFLRRQIGLRGACGGAGSRAHRPCAQGC